MEKTYDFSLNSIFLRLLPRCQDFEREVPTENTRLRRHTVATEADQRESSGLQRGVEGREDPTGMPEAARDPNQSWMILLEEKQKKTFEKKKRISQQTSESKLDSDRPMSFLLHIFFDTNSPEFVFWDS